MTAVTSRARKNVAILGSTGSIGTQALDVLARHRDRFAVVGLAAGRNVGLLAEQVQLFEPAFFTSAQDGSEGLRRIAVESGADIVLAATDGAVAFEAVFAAVERGIDIAVANKELIVAAGELLFEAARRRGSRIIPVDSEHSAVFQCLVGEPMERVAKVVLTASGGPFWSMDRAAMRTVSVDDALRHPTWNMGVKNTVDSATMMNKGLEVIEASRLFSLPPEKIEVLVHRTSVAHGLVIFTDGNVKAQLAPPDMRLPIGYALAYPDRLDDAGGMRAEDPLTALGARLGETTARLEFHQPDFERFPCLRLAYEALRRGGTVPAALSAANEIAVQAFVERRIAFGEIAEVVRDVLLETPDEPLSLVAVREADARARLQAKQLVARCSLEKSATAANPRG
ncbi:MAG TPA: 1-deoxy-D-xylulose-5-phosphate reductoisomerase [Candidatus Acidoferrales bacterium]|nr:1-deoxy-D-xylulose-5-phosphate reductoisomerase [Candidatus Acidoferrales bacterium]